MELEKEAADRRRKRMIQVISIALLGLLMFFTFFSNTLQSLTLPKVRTEKPVSGSILFTLDGSGILRPLAEAGLMNPAGWKVQEILVKPGDHVKKGQQLITYDSKSAERELEDEITNLNKQKIGLQNVQDQFILTAKEGEPLKIRSAGREIETLKLDLAAQERKINALRENLESQQELTAPFDGIITQVNAIEGLTSTAGPDILVSNNSLGYQLDVSVDSSLLTSLGIAAGEKIEVEVHSVQEQQSRMIGGVIEEIKNAEPLAADSSGAEGDKSLTIPRKLLHVRIVDAKLKGGEQAQIKIGKPSRQQGLIVSNEAVHREGDGSFVYKIEEQRGALGNVFVARKVQIQSSETNGKETMIQSDNLYEDDRIILESSEPLQDGNHVRLQ
ncbi:biotin/lipoyl-binding protein [Paenibacillus sepulcri]|uniref:Biotin/lipoyl-binding protein n=1 Tax=Paenibacillus sepulcri TaxID=359917 RepID=A0ABS7C0M0_9BACL|nr:biotin/lipoyl-binding protein [Paenibacillus sepulcri]